MKIYGRSEGIRTPDLMLPKHARYQTAPHSDTSERIPYLGHLVIVSRIYFKVKYFFEKGNGRSYYSAHILGEDRIMIDKITESVH